MDSLNPVQAEEANDRYPSMRVKKWKEWKTSSDHPFSY